MAYKVQIGPATLAGAISTSGLVTGAGLDAGDGNITNVGDIAVDSISADGNDIGIALTDDRGAALDIAEGGSSYLKFKTSNGSERIEAGQHIRLASGKKFQLGGGSDDQIEVDTDLKINAAADILLIPAGGDVKVTGNVSGSAAIQGATIAIVDPSSLAGAALVRNGSTLDVGVDGTGIEINSDALRLKDAGVVTAKIADANVTSAKIADNAVITQRIADEAVTYAKMQHVSTTARILGRNTSGAGDVEEVTPAQLMGMFNSDLGGDFSIGNQSSDSATFAGAVVVGGDLTVNGTTTTVNSTSVQIDDLNLQLADGAAAASAVNGGGITLANSGDDFTFAYNHASTAWKSSIDMDLASSKLLKIAGTEVLSAAGSVKVQSAVAGNGLAHSAGQLSVGVDGTGIEINSNALRLKDAGVVTAKIADVNVTTGKLADDAVTNAKLADNAVQKENLAADVAGAGLEQHSDDTIRIAASAAGQGLQGGAGAALAILTRNQNGLDFDGSNRLRARVDDSSLELYADGIQVKAGGITNTMLSGNIAHTKLADIAAGRILMGNGSNVPTATAISGELSLTALGSLTINNNAITQAKLADDAVGADELAADAVVEASIVDNAVTLAKMAGLAAGKFILGDSNGDPAAVTLSGDATVTNAGVIAIGAQKVLNSMLADDAVGADELIDNSVGAAAMADDAIETAFIVDDAVTADKLAANAVVDASVASNAAILASKINFNTDLGGDVTFGNQADDTISTAGHFTVGGNLTVNGSVTAINSATINITSSFTFEGPADAHETILSAGSPTADITVMLPQYGTAETVHMAVLQDASTDASANVSAAEFALLDGDTARGTSALADGDGFMHNDGGTMKHTNVLKMFEYTVAKIGGDATVADTGVLTIAANAVQGSMLNNDVISALPAISNAQIGDADELMISDGGTIKRADFSQLRDVGFAAISGDATVASGGALTIAATAVQAGMLNTDIISGQTALASGLVATDELMVSDAGTLKRMDASVLKVYADLHDVLLGDNGQDLVAGVNFFGTHGGAEAVDLPDSPALGTSVRVKAGPDCSSTNSLTINRQGSNTIDGQASLVIQSPFGAVEMVYVANNEWKVF